MKKLKLNIQLFASGTITFPASGYLQGKIEWSTVPDIENNRVTVVTKLYAHRTNSATTTGQSWSGSVKVGDNVKHTFSQLSQSTSVSSGWVLFKTYNDIVNYDGESIKQVTISGNVKGPSGTALANNNSSGSALVTLDELHSKPIVSIDSITELNSSLTGVSNDTFVQFLSQKRFVLSATPFDDATITGYSVKNGSTIVNNTTVTLDLNINELYVEANVVPIIASASDSMKAIGSVQQNYANYILYQKPTIEPTSTTTKRNGQTSGRVLLNTMGNYWVGQIGSITNTPVVKYRYWKRGTTEPSTWITIPSASVNLDNGRITVTDYEIGSANPSDPNYFDFQFAYDIRVQIEDSFYSTNTLKGVTVGEAVWSEYRDRVDFAKLSRKGYEIFSNEYSSNEIVIGKWINGKPIYRKVIESTSGAINTEKTIANITNLKELISLKGIIDIGTYGLVPLPQTFNTSNISTLYLDNLNNILLRITNNAYANKPVILIIEYTKTID